MFECVYGDEGKELKPKLTPNKIDSCPILKIWQKGCAYFCKIQKKIVLTAALTIFLQVIFNQEVQGMTKKEKKKSKEKTKHC